MTQSPLPPTPPPSALTLPNGFTAELRALIHAQPTPELRSSVIYNIVRECYDSVRAIHGADIETAERSSLGLVSDAAVRMSTPCTPPPVTRSPTLYRPRMPPPAPTSPEGRMIRRPGPDPDRVGRR